MLMITVSFANEKKVAFKGGVNISSIRGDLSDQMGSTLHPNFGIIGGASIEFPLSNQISLQPELLFNSKGYHFDAIQYDNIGNGTEISVDISLNYLTLPTFFKVKFNSNNKVIPNIYLGPVLGILLNAVEETDGEKSSVNNDYSTLDIGTIFGGEIHFMIDNRLLLLDLRYSLGLSNIHKNSADSWRTTNSTFSVMIGYGFTISRS